MKRFSLRLARMNTRHRNILGMWVAVTGIFLVLPHLKRIRSILIPSMETKNWFTDLFA